MIKTISFYQNRERNTLILSSLAMDLKRVSVGLYHKSFTMADRFTKEALLRRNETDVSILKPYMRTIIEKLETVLTDVSADRTAEDVLMYSTLIQNYVLKEKNK